MTGDLNVAHQPIDVFKSENKAKSAGHTKEERESFTKFLEDFSDTFRELHPGQTKYSYFNLKSGARQKNQGWRLDYVLASKTAKQAVVRSDIDDRIYGSDHLPIFCELDLTKLG